MNRLHQMLCASYHMSPHYSLSTCSLLHFHSSMLRPLLNDWYHSAQSTTIAPTCLPFIGRGWTKLPQGCKPRSLHYDVILVLWHFKELISCFLTLMCTGWVPATFYSYLTDASSQEIVFMCNKLWFNLLRYPFKECRKRQKQRRELSRSSPQPPLSILKTKAFNVQFLQKLLAV